MSFPGSVGPGSAAVAVAAHQAVTTTLQMQSGRRGSGALKPPYAAALGKLPRNWSNRRIVTSVLVALEFQTLFIWCLCSVAGVKRDLSNPTMYSDLVRTALVDFENGGFTRIKYFPFTLRWRNLKMKQSLVILDTVYVFETNHCAIVFEKPRC